ncbi:hypothetical protein NLJ89_g1459 [Agrocybe chaxingu]|uniref:C2H2-type domain-containing protein n=1 Tax=Agrocybe chaxingu TaxID=84603 RepID=A0A9W8MZZ0_9AGAR|nr:hypothetical protein NLJ89_g1459 [Agrocybe chaxingu]
MAYFPPTSWYTFTHDLEDAYGDMSGHSSNDWNPYAIHQTFTDTQIDPSTWADSFVIGGASLMESAFDFDASMGVAPSDVYPPEEEVAAETNIEDEAEGEMEGDDGSEGNSEFSDAPEPGLLAPGSPQSTLSESTDFALRRQPRTRSRFTPYDSPARRFSCTFCAMKMMRQSDLNRHLLTHKTKEFCCSELECPCGLGKMFSRCDARKRHVLTEISNKVNGFLAAGGQDGNRIVELRNQHQRIKETTSRKKRAA